MPSSRASPRKRRAAASLLALFLGLASLGRAAAGEGWREADGSLLWGGRERTYLLHLPAAPKSPLPLIIVLHGAGDNAAAFAAETQFAAAGEARGMATLFPNGTEGDPGKRTWNAHFCCGVAVREKVDDIGFILALIDELASRYPIDARRIYATGMSNGAMLTYQLAAAHAERFAAVAPVAGTIGGTSRDGERFVIRAPEHPVPVLIIHGVRDPYILFNGGSSTVLGFPKRSNMAVAEALRFWATVDGCEPLPDRDEPVPGKLFRIAYPDCRDGSAVTLLAIGNAEHYWPSDPIFPAEDGTMRGAAPEIVDFFAAHRRE